MALSETDYFSMVVSCVSVIVIMIVNLSISKVYKIHFCDISPRNMLDSLKWGTVLMTGVTPTLMFAPQNLAAVQYNMVFVGVWGVFASLFTLLEDMKEANATVFYHNRSPSGDRVLFLNSRRVLDIVLPLLNLAFSSLNLHYVTDHRGIPFRLSLIFRAVVVVIGSIRAMLAHVQEPKRVARRLEDQSLVEMCTVPDLASSIYDKIYEDKRDSVRPLSIPIQIIHAERCGLMSTPVVGSPAQSANVGSTYSPNTSLSHAAVASVHPGFRSPDAAAFSKLPRMPPNVPALEFGDSEHLLRCMHTGHSGEDMAAEEKGHVSNFMNHVYQYDKPANLQLKENVKRMMTTQSTHEDSSTTDQPLSPGSLEEMHMKKDSSQQKTTDQTYEEKKQAADPRASTALFLFNTEREKNMDENLALLKDLEVQLNQLKKDAEANSAQINQLEANKKTAESTISTMKCDLARQEQLVKDKNDYITDLEEEITRLTLETEKLKTEKDSGWAAEKYKIKTESYGEGIRSSCRTFIAGDSSYDWRSHFGAGMASFMADFAVKEAESIALKRTKIEATLAAETLVPQMEVDEQVGDHDGRTDGHNDQTGEDGVKDTENAAT